MFAGRQAYFFGAYKEEQITSATRCAHVLLVLFVACLDEMQGAERPEPSAIVGAKTCCLLRLLSPEQPLANFVRFHNEYATCKCSQ
jgi:hypothetical protein